ncbi:MAG: mannosyltransferase [Solirubrobacteraceae bacterium]|nr:mannosyltransferase [Solirubrobacteraceae bacterium]
MLLAGLLVLAAAVRFAGLGHQSFWLDEAFTERLLRHSFGDMLNVLPDSESTPPLYYVLAWPWARIFGFGEAGLRSLSALAGTLTVLAGWAAARRLAGPAAALATAAVLAVHPLLVWFSQEARAYALATLFAALSLWCWAALVQRGGRRWWIGWAAASAAALATHYFAAFLVAGEAAYLLWRAPDRRAVLLACAPVAAVGAALAPLALAQRRTGNTAYISEEGLGRRLVQVPKQLLVGYASPGQAVTAVLAVLLVAVALNALRRRDAPAGGRRALALAAFAILVPAALAVVGLDYFNGRNVLMALPALAVAIGAGLTTLRRPLAVSALAVLLLVVTVLDATDTRYQREDWRGAARALGPEHGARIVVATPSSADIALAPYLPTVTRLAPTGASVSEIDLLAIPLRSTGSGSQPPPRPAVAPRLPPQFVPAGRTLGARFTVLRFRAPAPQPVRPAQLTGDGLAPGAVTVLLQP